MKNAIMDTVEDFCRNADIPEGSTYAQAVSFIVKSIMNTDTMAAELPSSELTEYVKDYFPKDEYEVTESVNESGDYDKAYALGKEHALAGKPKKAPWPKEQPYDLHVKAYNMGYKDWQQKPVKESEDEAGAEKAEKANRGNYAEKLAKKVKPGLKTEKEVLDAGYKIAVADLGKKSASYSFSYDEDFPSDFVSAYFAINKKLKESKDKYTFQKINYGKFEQVSDSANDYDESAIDGARVLCAYDGKNCIAIYYAKAKTGSYCPEFKGDMMSFAEADTLCPLTEAHDTDMEFPKLLGKAGDFSVELNEGEKVSLMQRNKEIVSMPLVIWKQLSRG
jgi:hypothetical protein